MLKIAKFYKFKKAKRQMKYLELKLRLQTANLSCGFNALNLGLKNIQNTALAFMNKISCLIFHCEKIYLLLYADKKSAIYLNFINKPNLNAENLYINMKKWRLI